MSYNDEDFYNDYYDRRRSVGSFEQKTSVMDEFHSEPDTDNDCFESDSDNEESKNHFIKPEIKRAENDELIKATTNVLNTCSSSYINFYIKNNTERFRNLLRKPSDEFILVFNSKLIYAMNIEYLDLIVNHRDFYPNPFFLKNANIDDLYERIKYIRDFWWCKGKIFIRKTEDDFYNDERVLKIFNHFDIVLVKRMKRF